MMDKKVKLRENYEFKRAYKRGKFKANPLLVTYALKNRCGHVRFGITATKKVGKAHLRNRARRVIATAVRENLGQINGSYDLVFVARASTPFAKSQEISAAMQKQLKQLGLL